jgi:Skp family chaperone for outer membrane proteins
LSIQVDRKWIRAVAFATLVGLPYGIVPSVTSAADREFAGFVTEFANKESDVLPIVKEIAGDSVVRGTYMYDKDQTLTGAMPAKTSDAFGRWTGTGDVFYKVVTGVVAPRHFEQSSDLGTITVRYIVQSVAEERTRVRIDAIFIEDARRKAHASDSTVETSEFKAIQGKLQELQLARQRTQEERTQAAASEKKREEQAAAEQSASRDRQEEAERLNVAETSIHGLEGRLAELRRQVEVRIKSNNTNLKTAPFEKATTLMPMGAGTEVVVLIVTPAWYGVETSDGHHGWLRRDQVEQMP